METKCVSFLYELICVHSITLDIFKKTDLSSDWKTARKIQQTKDKLNEKVGCLMGVIVQFSAIHMHTKLTNRTNEGP